MANYAEIEREAKIYLDQCVHNDRIDPALFDKYGVKRGLREGRQRCPDRHHQHFPYRRIPDGGRQKDSLRGQTVVPRL